MHSHHELPSKTHLKRVKPFFSYLIDSPPNFSLTQRKSQLEQATIAFNFLRSTRQPMHIDTRTQAN